MIYRKALDKGLVRGRSIATMTASLYALVVEVGLLVLCVRFRASLVNKKDVACDVIGFCCVS